MIARRDSSAFGVPGASAPLPPWVVLLSALTARLVAAGRRIDDDMRPATRAARLDAAAHSIVAMLALLGWRPLRVMPAEGDLLAVWCAAWDGLSRDLVERSADLPPIVRASVITLGAYVEDTARWVSDA